METIKTPKISQLLALWWWRYKTRRQLQADRNLILKDLGVAQSDILNESKKPFWRK